MRMNRALPVSWQWCRCVSAHVQVDLGDMENEVRTAEESAKKALADSQRLADDLRRQQDAVASSEKQRRTVETQARHLTSLISSGGSSSSSGVF